MDHIKFTWTKIEAKPDPEYGVPITRSSHGVSYSQRNDSLIVFGGEHIARTPIEDEASCCWVCTDVTTAKPTSSAEWKRITCSSTASSAPPSRIAHAQAMYDDRYVYIFGGRAGITMEEKALSDLWVLDTEKYTWSEVLASGGDPAPEARSFHRMVCVASNLYVFGGCSAKHGRLNDLHQFDIATSTWHTLGSSMHLRGRGGANLVPLLSGQKLAVIGGFAGEETADGHIYNTISRAWEPEALTAQLNGLRPRSVCLSGSFPTLDLALIVGGEVDPSDLGHEGAGGFENDIVLLNGTTGAYIATRNQPSSDSVPSSSSSLWPEQRGWADAASVESDSHGSLILFGGLSGDDKSPKRLNDLWRLDIRK